MIFIIIIFGGGVGAWYLGRCYINGSHTIIAESLCHFSLPHCQSSDPILIVSVKMKQ